MTSVTETAEFVFKVMSARNSGGKTSSTKGNNGRKHILQDRDVRALVQGATRGTMF